MKNKKLILVIVIVLVLMVGGLFCYKFILDSNDNNSVMEDIKASYNKIEDDIDSYNSVRDDLILVMKNYYSDNLEGDYSKFLDNLKEIDKILSGIDENVNKLDKLCLDRLFKEVEVNNMCADYKKYYETLVNVYMNDINKVNKFINDYNTLYNKDFELYTSSLVKDYIDYNNDGIYLEREDNNG